MIIRNHDSLPDTQTVITPEDKQRLIEAYEVFPLIPNILTRDIKIFTNL